MELSARFSNALHCGGNLIDVMESYGKNKHLAHVVTEGAYLYVAFTDMTLCIIQNSHPRKLYLYNEVEFKRAVQAVQDCSATKNCKFFVDLETNEERMQFFWDMVSAINPAELKQEVAHEF